MKKFKSINRQIKHGNLKLEFNTALQKMQLKRRTGNGKWVLYMILTNIGSKAISAKQ